MGRQVTTREKRGKERKMEQERGVNGGAGREVRAREKK